MRSADNRAASAVAAVGGEVAIKLKSSGLWGWCIALAVSYYFAALLGLRFRFPHSQISIIWPPNALLLSALILTHRNKWWAVLATAALAQTAALGQVVPGWRDRDFTGESEKEAAE